MAQQGIHERLDRSTDKRQIPSDDASHASSTGPKSTRVPEFMHAGTMAAAVAILLVVVIATAAPGWCLPRTRTPGPKSAAQKRRALPRARDVSPGWEPHPRPSGSCRRYTPGPSSIPRCPRARGP